MNRMLGIAFAAGALALFPGVPIWGRWRDRPAARARWRRKHVYTPLDGPPVLRSERSAKPPQPARPSLADRAGFAVGGGLLAVGALALVLFVVWAGAMGASLGGVIGLIAGVWLAFFVAVVILTMATTL